MSTHNYAFQHTYTARPFPTTPLIHHSNRRKKEGGKGKVDRLHLCQGPSARTRGKPRARDDDGAGKSEGELPPGLRLFLPLPLRATTPIRMCLPPAATGRCRELELEAGAGDGRDGLQLGGPGP
ncbi:hypothetical protein V2G26_013599 [Clonostachys chloroleuca]